VEDVSGVQVEAMAERVQAAAEEHERRRSGVAV